MGKLDHVKKEMLDGAERALKVIGNDLLGEAARDAPVDEGTLRGSGTAVVTRTPTSVNLVVSFNTPYAARQHEEMTWIHPKGGHAKYLERPYKAKLARYKAALAKSMQIGHL